MAYMAVELATFNIERPDLDSMTVYTKIAKAVTTNEDIAKEYGITEFPAIRVRKHPFFFKPYIEIITPKMSQEASEHFLNAQGITTHVASLTWMPVQRVFTLAQVNMVMKSSGGPEHAWGMRYGLEQVREWLKYQLTNKPKLYGLVDFGDESSSAEVAQAFGELDFNDANDLDPSIFRLLVAKYELDTPFNKEALEKLNVTKSDCCPAIVFERSASENQPHEYIRYHGGVNTKELQEWVDKVLSGELPMIAVGGAVGKDEL